MPKFNNSTFTVKHFASDVTYTVDGFLDKNKDTVNEQLLEVVSKTKVNFFSNSSCYMFLQFDFLRTITANALTAATAGNKRKATVAVQFRQSLKELVTVLEGTRQHYVRCIKVNMLLIAICSLLAFLTCSRTTKNEPSTSNLNEHANNYVPVAFSRRSESLRLAIHRGRGM